MQLFFVVFAAKWEIKIAFLRLNDILIKEYLKNLLDIDIPL